MDYGILAIIGVSILISYVVFWKAGFKYITGLTILLAGLMLTAQATSITNNNFQVYNNDTSTTIHDLNFLYQSADVYKEQQGLNLASMILVFTGLGVVMIDGINRVYRND